MTELPKLPAGWTWATPEELAVQEKYALAIGPFGSNLKVSDYRPEGVPLVFVRNIRTQRFAGEGSQFVTAGKAAALAAHRVDPGDVLVTKMGDPPGDACVYPAGRPPAIITADCIKFRVAPKRGSPSFFAYAFATPAVRAQVLARTKGVAQQKISLDTFRSLKLPVAPRAEQDRIVAEIEKQFTRLGAGVAALERLRAHLRRYRAGMLKAACEGRLVASKAAKTTGTDLLKELVHERRNRWDTQMGHRKYVEPAAPVGDALPCAPPAGWVIASLDQLTDACRPICYGILMPKENVAGGVLYVKVKDMKGDKIDVRNLHRTAPDIAAAYSRASLRTGDVLLAIRGTYGRVAEVPPELEGGNITQDTARIAVLDGVDRRYVAWFLRSPDAQNYFKRVARGVAVKGVNIGDVRPAPILLPPRDVQTRIVDEIERRLSDADAVEREVASSLDRAGRLRASILRSAFEGHLVAPEQPARAPAA